MRLFVTKFSNLLDTCQDEEPHIKRSVKKKKEIYLNPTGTYCFQLCNWSKRY
jgi:hypothetical protein